MCICRRSSQTAARPCHEIQQEMGKVLVGEVDNEGVIAGAGVKSDDELDSAGTGSGEEAMEEADEEDEGIADDEFTLDN